MVSSNRDDLFKVSGVEKNQGIAAKVSSFQYAELEDIIENGKKDPKGNFILVLDGIQDPQNLGSIIRTAFLIGVHGIIIPENNSADIGPASSRASAGAVEYLPIVKVTNITRTLKHLKTLNIWIVGAEGGGENLYGHKFEGNYAIVIGSEGKGIRRLVKEECDFHVSIPMNPITSGVGSYNASVATAIVLSEVARQRLYKTV